MKVLHINIFGNLSTGKIAVDIARTLQESGHDCLVAYARNDLASDVNGIKIGKKTDVYVHGIMTRITGKAGFYSKRATIKLIEKINDYKPDVIHLHNLHGYYINIELLFNYLCIHEIPIVWTLHDCWGFTGHCAYFDYYGCYKWKTGCYECPQKKSYPASLFMDNSKWNYIKKKVLFTKVNNMVLVTPSQWLANLVKNSFLKKYPIKVIHNGIDLNVFKPTNSTWKQKFGLENKKIILSVASTWSKNKGLKDMIILADMLKDNYQVVVVGVSKKQKKLLPKKVIGIIRTYNNKELAEIYTAAYLLVNPTYEDNFPTVNIEALACGTPVITYQTGGSPEALSNDCGAIIEQGNIQGICDAIYTLSFDSDKCVENARMFESNLCFHKYINIYKQLLNK